MKSEKMITATVTALAAIFAVVTVFILLADGRPDRLLLAIATVFLAMLPAALEKLFCCRINLPIGFHRLLSANSAEIP